MTARKITRPFLAALLVLLIVTPLCACGPEPAEPSIEELLISRDWLSITDEDSYSFYIDGSGKHGKTVISYTYDPGLQILEICEDTEAPYSYSMTVDTSGEFPRLFPEDMSQCYVTADDYDAAAGLVAMFGAASVGGANLVDKVLLSDVWRNINDEDIYSFNADGSGKHGNISLSYSYSADSKTLEITEGMGSVSSCSMRLNTDGAFPRLIPADRDTYYVRACDYEEISEIVRSENISILTSVGSWQSLNTWTGRSTDKGTGDTRLVFAEGGKGRVLFILNMQTYVDEPLYWEMLDNDTVDCSFTAFGKEMDLDLDIRNKDGEYILYVHNDPSIYYLPDI